MPRTTLPLRQTANQCVRVWCGVQRGRLTVVSGSTFPLMCVSARQVMVTKTTTMTITSDNKPTKTDPASQLTVTRHFFTSYIQPVILAFLLMTASSG